MRLDKYNERYDLVCGPEKVGYFALMLAILKDHSSSQALRYIEKD